MGLVESGIRGLWDANPELLDLLIQDASYMKDAADGAAADTTASRYYWVAPFDVTLVDAWFVPNGTIAAHATDGATLQIVSANGAGGADVVEFSSSTLTAAQGAVGDGVPKQLLRAATAAGELTGGKVLGIQIAKSGNGQIVPVGAFVVRYKPAR